MFVCVANSPPLNVLDCSAIESSNHTESGAENAKLFSKGRWQMNHQRKYGMATLQT